VRICFIEVVILDVGTPNFFSILKVALGKFAPLMVLVAIGRGATAATYGSCWIYIMELYPTSIRSSAGALGYGVSRIGSTIGAYMSHLVSNHFI